jgi:hypothetical protein
MVIPALEKEASNKVEQSAMTRLDRMICFSEVFRLVWRFRAPEPLLSCFPLCSPDNFATTYLFAKKVHSVTVHLVTFEKSSLW